MIRGLLGLYRLDVFARFFLLYLLGAVIAGGTLPPLREFVIAFLISGISLNFVYSLNSWADADIDAINKPHRPIPAGLVTRRQALLYSLVLLGASLAYPFLLFGLSAKALLFLWFPVAGILYSNPAYPFKKKRLLALFLITATVLVTALFGYVANGGVFDTRFYFFALLLLVACASLVPLKDLPDVAGDRAYGAENWFSDDTPRGGILRRVPPNKLHRFVAITSIIVLALAIVYLMDARSTFVF